MLRSIFNAVKERILGRLVHAYEPLEVKHGPMTCRDRFSIRERKGTLHLVHDRVCQDAHDVDKWFHEYDADEVDRLCEVFVTAGDLMERREPHDFGVIIEERDGRMQSRETFSVAESSGQWYLYCRIDSGAWGSSHTNMTYFPPEEAAAITEVLLDARSRLA
jgi:hypothetical protein